MAKTKMIIEDAIKGRKILEMVYQHTSDGETVDHEIAPFDIGSTNQQRKKQFAEMLFAYSYTHVDKEGKKNPKACAFKVPNIISLDDSGRTFDPIQVTDMNKKATGYDYRDCEFAMLPNRDWYS